MSTGETLLVVGVVAVVGYLLYQNTKPAPAPGPNQVGGYGPPPAPSTNKYDFYSLVTRESADTAREAIRTFGPQPDPAARTAP
jgi:hypothetical protein